MHVRSLFFPSRKIYEKRNKWEIENARRSQETRPFETVTFASSSPLPASIFLHALVYFLRSSSSSRGKNDTETVDNHGSLPLQVEYAPDVQQVKLHVEKIADRRSLSFSLPPTSRKYERDVVVPDVQRLTSIESPGYDRVSIDFYEIDESIVNVSCIEKRS